MVVERVIDSETEELIIFRPKLELKQFLNIIITLLRTKQWIKNLFVFAGLVFSLNIFDFQLSIITFYAFLSFCFLSSSVYIINDLVDVEEDRLHPKKKNRLLYCIHRVRQSC